MLQRKLIIIMSKLIMIKNNIQNYNIINYKKKIGTINLKNVKIRIILAALENNLRSDDD